jgi:hypothetical protein
LVKILPADYHVCKCQTILCLRPLLYIKLQETIDFVHFRHFLGLFENFKQQLALPLYFFVHVLSYSAEISANWQHYNSSPPLANRWSRDAPPPPTPDRRDGGASGGVGREIIRGGRGGGGRWVAPQDSPLHRKCGIIPHHCATCGPDQTSQPTFQSSTHRPTYVYKIRVVYSVADPGSCAFLTPGSGMGKKSGSGMGKKSGSVMNKPRSYFRELRNNFLGLNT